jgi:hypothetical protein
MINMQPSPTVTHGRRSQFAADAPPVGRVTGKLTVVIFGGRRMGYCAPAPGGRPR